METVSVMQRVLIITSSNIDFWANLFQKIVCEQPEFTNLIKKWMKKNLFIENPSKNPRFQKYMKIHT